MEKETRIGGEPNFTTAGVGIYPCLILLINKHSEFVYFTKKKDTNMEHTIYKHEFKIQRTDKGLVFICVNYFKEKIGCEYEWELCEEKTKKPAKDVL